MPKSDQSFSPTSTWGRGPARRSSLVVEFLREHAAEHIFPDRRHRGFLGDEPQHLLKPSHNTVVQKLFGPAAAAGGADPRNHDEALRDYCGVVFGDIEVANELVHKPPTASASC